jgi:hypothetical protein
MLGLCAFGVCSVADDFAAPEGTGEEVGRRGSGAARRLAIRHAGPGGAGWGSMKVPEGCVAFAEELPGANTQGGTRLKRRAGTWKKRWP